MQASTDLKQMMTDLCSHFYGDKSHVRLLVVFGTVRTMHTVNLVSQSLGIPVIGYIMDMGDGHVQVRSTAFFN